MSGCIMHTYVSTIITTKCNKTKRHKVVGEGSRADPFAAIRRKYIAKTSVPGTCGDALQALAASCVSAWPGWNWMTLLIYIFAHTPTSIKACTYTILL